MTKSIREQLAEAGAIGQFRPSICPGCNCWTEPGTKDEPLFLHLESKTWIHWRCWQRMKGGRAA